MSWLLIVVPNFVLFSLEHCRSKVRLKLIRSSLRMCSKCSPKTKILRGRSLATLLSSSFIKSKSYHINLFHSPDSSKSLWLDYILRKEALKQTFFCKISRFLSCLLQCFRLQTNCMPVVYKKAYDTSRAGRFLTRHQSFNKIIIIQIIGCIIIQ